MPSVDFPTYEAKLTESIRLLRQLRQARVDGSEDIVSRYRGASYEFITDGLRDFRGDSWRTWRIVLKAAYGRSLTDAELVTFREVAHRDPPGRRVKELWCLIGARGGKDSIASAMAVEAACYADEGVALRPGERAVVACFATKLDQASIIYNYTRAYFERIPALRRLVTHPLLGTRPRPILLQNNVEIRTVVSNLTAPRGWPIACAIFDEICFWRDEESANPDIEVYTAVLRGMGTIPNAMIIGITTPYRQKGLAFDKWKKYFGVNDPNVLAVQGSTLQFHPGFDQSVIDRAIEEDPERASAEYLGEWRRDLADYVQREIVEAAVPRGLVVVPPDASITYEAFSDPSGGSVDSMTLGIAHRDGDRGILDCVLETRAPFQPSTVVEEHAKVLRQYGLNEVHGDRYAGSWPTEAFAKYGISYIPSELSKSDIYRDFLPFLNSGRAQLLDIPRLVNQLCRLERRTARGGRDSIDHPPKEHDDVINSAAGALLRVLGEIDPVTAMLRSMGH